MNKFRCSKPSTARLDVHGNSAKIFAGSSHPRCYFPGLCECSCPQFALKLLISRYRYSLRVKFQQPSNVEAMNMYQQ